MRLPAGAMSTSPLVNNLMGLCDDLVGGSSLMWRYHHQARLPPDPSVASCSSGVQLLGCEMVQMSPQTLTAREQHRPTSVQGPSVANNAAGECR
jgi:hypothetical protein